MGHVVLFLPQATYPSHSPNKKNVHIPPFALFLFSRQVKQDGISPLEIHKDDEPFRVSRRMVPLFLCLIYSQGEDKMRIIMFGCLKFLMVRD